MPSKVQQQQRRQQSRSLFLPTLALSIVTLTSSANADGLPRVDFGRMGKVGIAGSFSGLDFFNSSTPTHFDQSTSTLFARSVSDGSITSLGSTNAGGTVLASCTLNGKTYFAGSFESVAGTAVKNVAVYDPATGKFSPLGGTNGGVNDEVDALHCDSSSSTVWVGGKFSAPVNAQGTYRGAVALYKPSDDSWSPPPFAGLTGAAGQVLSITPSNSGSSLYFSGSFITSFQSNTTNSGSNNPNVPFSSGATPFTSSLVPIPLSNIEINASPSSSQKGFSDVKPILCPTGPDGPGHTWFSESGGRPLITVRTFRFITASGIRLGNTFLDGRGTTAFTVTSIPDNQVLALSYNDPTNNSSLKCTENCPLLTNSSVPYQDFLFDAGVQSITGFQLAITQYQGPSAGLHILQLLSDGAFASAIADQNTNSCFSPNPSSIKQTGQWKVVPASTDIPGTTQDILLASVPVGSSPSSTTLTWYPYVSASGTYDIYVLIPGCIQLQDCAARTSVKVTVFPGGTASPRVSTFSQRVEQDTKQLVYSGPVFTTGPTFVATITLSLADQPEGAGVKGKYDLVADRVQLQLKSVATVGSSGSNNGTTGAGAGSGGTQGFGFFEWSLNNQQHVDASTALPNSSFTSSDQLGLDLIAAIGAATGGSTSNSTNSSSIVRAVAPVSANTTYVAGLFTLPSGATNILSFDGASVKSLTGNGLNGVVNALAFDNGILYVGGAFQDTVAGGTGSRFKGITRYNVNSGEWSAMEGGVDGTVTSISLSNNQLSIAGNFTRTLFASSPNDGTQAGGLATWDIASSEWTSSGAFLVGNMSLTSAPTTDKNKKATSDTEYVAGNVQVAQRFGADGWAMLGNGKNGQVVVMSTGASLFDGSSPASPAPAKSKRANSNPSSWLDLVRRQQTSTPATLPPSSPAPAPAVLAGTFWTNTSTSHEVIIIGGNFSFSAPSSASPAANIAIYDPTSKFISALSGNQLGGVVRALAVVGSSLFIGGEFTQPAGFAAYDLVKQQWRTDVPGLQGQSGSNVVIHSLVTSTYKSNLLVAAGSFAQAGSLPCEAVCAYDTSSNQWTSLGNGVRGSVSSVDFAGSDSDIMIVGGSLTLSDGTPANVASYSFKNASWQVVGDAKNIPGPITALSVNNGNSSSIFAAGVGNTGATPFLIHWDGNSWTSQGSPLQGTSVINQLTLVPLLDDHSANGVIEPDRMLLVSGNISADFGSASSALYDGANYHPYITTTTALGAPAIISAFFNSFRTFSFNRRKFLATGVVILISIAIAAGIVFFMLLAGVLWTLFHRKDEGIPYPNAIDDDDDDSLHRPSSLLNHINAATRKTILGGAALGAGLVEADDPFAPTHKAEDTAVTQVEPASTEGHDGSGFVRTVTPVGVTGMTEPNQTAGEEDIAREARARYSFAGDGVGELALTAGAEVIVLDDRDPSWWYARDAQTGLEGVVPAAYLY